MSKEGKVYKYGDLELQAVNGTIRLINHSEKYKHKPERFLTLQQWAKRCLSLNLCCQYYASKDFLTASEKDLFRDYDKLYDLAMTVGREAKQQGDPLDPAVAKDKLEEFRSGAKHNIIIP